MEDAYDEPGDSRVRRSTRAGVEGAGRGKAGIEASFNDIFRIFADWTIRVDDLLIDHDDGDRAAYVFTHMATHVGETLGFPPSGRPVTIPGVCLFRFDGDRIAAEQLKAFYIKVFELFGAAADRGSRARR